MSVEEVPLIRSDLYLADEFFMTGTAAEVTPVRAVDDQELGVGPVTREIQTSYLDTVNGRIDRWAALARFCRGARRQRVAHSGLSFRCRRRRAVRHHPVLVVRG